ncbi:hypothetical protein PVAG01_02111 [Phlyctema vagabunda]|uniref:Extracellular membrane protein CFEM domain-containing protein n=1 Tax=Phlyctema vagabunda TaxID=108571 RepID=A0ABR4PPK8_9HELO
MRLLLFALPLAQAMITRPAIDIIAERQAPQTVMNTHTPSLNDNSACLLLGTALYICETLTPSFTALAATLQAPCLCYSSTDWVPSIFDTAVERCAGFAESAVPFAFGDVDGLRGFCGGVGDVLARPNNIPASTTTMTTTETTSEPSDILSIETIQSTSSTTEIFTSTSLASITTVVVQPSTLSTTAGLSSTSDLSTAGTTLPLDFYSSLIRNPTSTSLVSSASPESSRVEPSLRSSLSSSTSSEAIISKSSPSTRKHTTLSTSEISTDEHQSASSYSKMMTTSSSRAMTIGSAEEASDRKFVWSEYDYLIVSFLIAMLLTFLTVLVAIFVKWLSPGLMVESLANIPRKDNMKTLLGDMDFEDTDIDTPNMI